MNLLQTAYEPPLVLVGKVYKSKRKCEDHCMPLSLTTMGHKEALDHTATSHVFILGNLVITSAKFQAGAAILRTFIKQCHADSLPCLLLCRHRDAHELSTNQLTRGFWGCYVKPLGGHLDHLGYVMQCLRTHRLTSTYCMQTMKCMLIVIPCKLM